MFRIEELHDGTTVIRDRISGYPISRFKAPQRPASVDSAISKGSSPALSESHPVSSPSAAAIATRSSPPPGRHNPSPNTSTSSSSSAAPDQHQDQSGGKPAVNRTLRSRNAVTQPQSNEDTKRLDSPSGSSASRKRLTATARKQPARGPDHMVVVFEKRSDHDEPAPKRMRLLPAATFSKVRQNFNKLNRQSDEPEMNEIDMPAFARYLGLIPKRKLERGDFPELESTYPLRTHCRRRHGIQRQIIQKVGDDENGPASPTAHPIMLVDSREPNNNHHHSGSIASLQEKILSEAQSSTNKLGALVIRSGKGWIVAAAPLNMPFTSVPPFDHHRSTTTTSPPTAHKRENYSLNHRNLNKFVLKYSKVEFSSPLGRWLPEIHPFTRLTQDDARRLIHHHHDRSTANGFRHEWLNQKPSFDFSFTQLLPGISKAGVRSTRQFQVTGICMSSITQMSNFVHTYTFSRQERMEKFLTLDTGLDWRGRLLDYHCRPITVQLPRLHKCAYCKSQICPKKGHSCGVRKNEPSHHRIQQQQQALRRDRPPPLVAMQPRAAQSLPPMIPIASPSTLRHHHQSNGSRQSSCSSQNVVSSTTPTTMPRTLIRSSRHMQVSSSSDEDVILIGQGQPMPAPPILYRSLSQQNHRTVSGTGTGGISAAAAAHHHATLFNIQTVRQSLNEKLKKGSYFDKKSQIMIEEVDMV